MGMSCWQSAQSPQLFLHLSCPDMLLTCPCVLYPLICTAPPPPPCVWQDADELFLYHVFGAYGALTFCKMINDPETNRWGLVSSSQLL
jgi:hypothetical protein